MRGLDPFLNNVFDGSPINFTQSIPPRNSEDTKSNSRGDELLDFCKSNEFAIVNGRKVGDLFGKYTSHQYNGSSAVDFVITPITEFAKISYFEVGDFTLWLSDHTPLFSYVTLDTVRNSSKTPITLHERNQGFYWNVECEEQFKAFLTNQREKLEEINEETKSNQDANKLANEIKQQLLEASDRCNLKRKRHKNSVSTKPWFDKECLDLKKCITKIGKKLQANAGDKEIRNEVKNDTIKRIFLTK